MHSECLFTRRNAVATAVLLTMAVIGFEAFNEVSRFRNHDNKGTIHKMPISEGGHELKMNPDVSFEPKPRPKEKLDHLHHDKDNTEQTGDSTYEPLPPLETLIGTSNNTAIHNDVQKLLHASILGFPKCGTTTLMHWMSQHPELCVYEHEYRYYGKPSKLASMLYNLCPETSQYGKRIFKNPNQLYYRPDPEMLRDYFPKTKVIVGVRAPVSWFPSFYNFRTRSGQPMPPPLDFLSGTSCDEGQGLCIERAYFATFLSFLGKTAFHNQGVGQAVMDSTQLALVNASGVWKPKRLLFPPLPNELFLYDVSQLDFERNPRIANKFRFDLTSFLELKNPLQRSEIVHSETHATNQNSTHVIDICDSTLDPLRQTLLEIGKNASDWILNYFLPHPTVTVSSPEYFKQILQSWSKDPCVTD